MTLTSAHRRLLKRSLKVGIAAGLATLCSQLLGLPNPWFATLAAIVAMQGTLQATFRSGRNSILGAFIGAAVGLGVAFVAKDQAWAVGAVVMVPLATFGWFRLPSIGQQAALVASVVVLVPERPELSTFDFAVVRLEQAIIGIVVAMAVQALVFPTRAHHKVRIELAGVYRDMARLLGHVTEALDQDPYDRDSIRGERVDARTRLVQVDEMWDDAMSEHPSHGLLASHWRVTTRRIWEQCSVLATEVADVQGSDLLTACHDDLTHLTSVLQESFRTIASWFHGRAADDPLVLPDIEPARQAVLRHVREAEAKEIEATDSYARTLQALAVANACNVIAERLEDLSTQHDDAVRIHGPIS